MEFCMNLETLRDVLPDYARDLRLNLDSVLTEQGAPGLTRRQIWLVAVAASIAARHQPLTRAVVARAAVELEPVELDAARAAAAIMAMNNVYYRFTHLVENADYLRMPARLRMNVMANPGVDKPTFELASLAVSAINGCGKCMASHERELRKHEVSAEAVHSAARIAAVLSAVAVTLEQAAAAGAVVQAEAA
jgi:lipoyl-dependent peroxiredoxin subunit D